MATERERFWTENTRFAFVGHQAKAPFPKLSFGKALKLGKEAYAIDPSQEEVQGVSAFNDFSDLPHPVDAAVIEVPKEETESWVIKAADAGAKNIWIHMGRETPEALAAAEARGAKLYTGTCAVMYLTPHFSFHSIHKWVNKLAGKY